ncbi:membrane protein insertase YidC, partial [Candidatus Dependentiae bacterium]|nr:membrane protein insertase YidC [Candidatus Dependentiae bacterium]
DTDGFDVLKGILAKENKSLEKKSLKDLQLLGKEKPTLFGLEDRYFINALIADPQGFAQRAYFKIDGIQKAESVYQADPVNQTTTWTMSFYCGPKEIAAFAVVDKRLDGSLDYGWLALFSKPLLYALNWLNKFLKNYGLAIIALTVLLKLAMAPLTFKSEASRKQQAEMQRRLKYLEQKYRNEPEELSRAKAELMTKFGVSTLLTPLAVVLQFPIFIGLNRVLSNSIELYKAPFAWIPDLSARDPYYILPVLFGVGIVIQMRSTQGSDPRQGLVTLLLGLVLAAFTSNISAGLALFMAVSTLLGLAQTFIIKAAKA